MLSDLGKALAEGPWVILLRQFAEEERASLKHSKLVGAVPEKRVSCLH